MKTIKLSNGLEAIVDDEDYEWLSQYKWHRSIRKDGNDYAYRSVWDGERQTNIFMHREIMAAGTGEEVDHIHHNTLDNRRQELRLCTRTQNAHNRKRNDRYTGIHKRGNVWYAEISVGGERRRLGRFLTQEQAAYAYNEAIKEHGLEEFAPTNDVDPQHIPSHARYTHIAKGRRGSSKFLGVSWSKVVKKWRAEISVTRSGKRERFFLGYFESESDAAEARRVKAEELGLG